MGGNTLLNRIITVFWIVFRLNLLLLAANIILIVALLFVVFYWITLPVYLLGLLMLIISLQGLFQTLRRLDRLEKMSLTKLYILCYREELKSTVKFALCYVIVALLLYGAYVIVQYAPNIMLFAPVYTILAVILYVHLILSMLIRANFFIGIWSTWRLGFYCISRHPLYALFILGGTFILGALINTLPQLAMLGALPAAGYLLTVSTRKLFKDLTVKLNITNEEETTDVSKNDG